MGDKTEYRKGYKPKRNRLLEWLGGGMARDAGEKINERDSRIDQAVDEASGYKGKTRRTKNSTYEEEEP